MRVYQNICSTYPQKASTLCLRTHDEDINHISTITKRALNKLTGCRQVSIQEAVHEIAGLDLVLCSDYLTDVSLGRALYLRKDSSNGINRKDLISCYRNRPLSFKHLSLEKYFYDNFCKKEFYTDPTTKRIKDRILIPKGLNCRPRYPVDYDYAKGMLVMHRPWSTKQPLTALLSDEQKTIDTFLTMLRENKVPYYVKSEFHRAVRYSSQYQYETLVKRVETDQTINIEDLDDDELADFTHWEHSRSLSAQNRMNLDDKIGEQRGNIGLDHDWTTTYFKGRRNIGETPALQYTKYLKDVFYGERRDNNIEKLIIPKKKDGSDYRLEDLNEEQQTVVICAVEAIVKFLTNDPTYQPLRATVVGCGGTGKSFIVNTLISLVRTFTQNNDAVKVAAPSGGAAYNVGGCTLHRCLNLSVDKRLLAKSLSTDKQADLARIIENMLMLIIDERSMISSSLLAAAERNVRECAFGQQNQDERWGGVPVILLFGDDYQLFPVCDEGAIVGYSHRNDIWDQNDSKNSPELQILIDAGNKLFIDDLTRDVFHLTVNYRSREDPNYAQILARLRTGINCESDGERFMRQCMFHHRLSNAKWVEEVENHPKTMFLYTRNHDVDLKNQEKLVHLSREKNVPIACLECQFLPNTNQGHSRNTGYKSHFRGKQIPEKTKICVHSKVAISGLNIIPEAGLYNGARGTIIDIIYDSVCGPNNKHGDHLPRYVIVDFPGLKLGNAQPWDHNNPTVSRIENHA